MLYKIKIKNNSPGLAYSIENNKPIIIMCTFGIHLLYNKYFNIVTFI